MLGCPHCARQGYGGSDRAHIPSPTFPLAPAAGVGQGCTAQTSHWDLPTRAAPSNVLWGVPGEGAPLSCHLRCCRQAQSPAGQPGSHGHPPVPSKAKTRREGREKSASLFPKGSGKKCCVTRGTAKTNRPWQPHAAPGQAAQTAPAGCGMRTDRQSRGSLQRIPCRALVMMSCPWRRAAGGAHPQRAFLTMGHQQSCRGPATRGGNRAGIWPSRWTGTDTAPAPSAPWGALGDPIWAHRARTAHGLSRGRTLLPSSRGHGPEHSSQDGEMGM